MLNEQNNKNEIDLEKKDFVQKLDIKKSFKQREDILKSFNDEIIVEDLSEEYNYTKFSSENIREKYDRESILSDEDITALSCLYGAIKSGNMQEYKIEDNKINVEDNKINTFLKENPNNIVILIDLMLRDAKNMYEGLDHESLLITTSIQGLISGSYDEILEIIKKYKEEKDLSRS